MTFIEQQKELAREEMKGMYYDDNDEFPHKLDTLITQVITNVGEELMRRLEADRAFRDREENERGVKYNSKWAQHNSTIDRAIIIIKEVTGVENV